MQILTDFHQGSLEWYQIHSTKITMSNAKALLTKGDGQTRRSYLQSVAASILAGVDEDGYQSSFMLRGIELEQFARRAGEAVTGIKFDQVGFVLADDERIGCSPDGLAIDRFTGCEIKCPLPKHHVRYLDLQQVIKDHGHQIQGNMLVCNAEFWRFFSFCPEVPQRPLITHVITRDDAMCAAIIESAKRGADEIEEIVSMFTGYPSRDDVGEIAKEASAHWSALQAELHGDVKL